MEFVIQQSCTWILIACGTGCVRHSGEGEDEMFGLGVWRDGRGGRTSVYSNRSPAPCPAAASTIAPSLPRARW